MNGLVNYVCKIMMKSEMVKKKNVGKRYLVCMILETYIIIVLSRIVLMCIHARMDTATRHASGKHEKFKVV